MLRRWHDLLLEHQELLARVLGRVSADGTKNEVLYRTGDAELKGLSLSTDGKAAAMVGSSPTSPRNIYTWAVGGEKPEKRTTLNPWLADVKLGHQETIRYAARDGLEIEGLLLDPVKVLLQQLLVGHAS